LAEKISSSKRGSTITQVSAGWYFGHPPGYDSLLIDGHADTWTHEARGTSWRPQGFDNNGCGIEASLNLASFVDLASNVQAFQQLSIIPTTFKLPNYVQAFQQTFQKWTFGSQRLFLVAS